MKPLLIEAEVTAPQKGQDVVAHEICCFLLLRLFVLDMLKLLYGVYAKLACMPCSVASAG